MQGVSSYRARNILGSGSRYVRSETSYSRRVRVIKPQEICIRSDRYTAVQTGAAKKKPSADEPVLLLQPDGC